jgi:flagellar FliL protein
MTGIDIGATIAPKSDQLNADDLIVGPRTILVTAVKGTDLKTLFEGSKPRLTDVTLNVLSALTLADLEEPGSKNIIREKLVNAYNQALGKKVADQVYFSDFVVQ